MRGYFLLHLVIASSIFVLVASCGGKKEEPEIPAKLTGPYKVVPVANGGVIKGTATVKGDVQTARASIPMRHVSNGQEECCEEGKKDKPQQQLRGNGAALQDVVVWLTDCTSGKAPAFGRAELDQTSCDFFPHVLAVMVGDSVTMRNSDPVVHSVHGYKGIRTLFNIATPMRDLAYYAPCRDTGLIACLCDAGHVWMKAFIHVLPNPYFAVTDADGNYVIDGVPPGTYTVRMAHELWNPVEFHVTVGANGAPTVQCDVELELTPSHLAK
jgi:plastocyanin